MAGEKEPKKDKKKSNPDKETKKVLKDAMKISQKLAARNQLELREILTEPQKRAAKLIGEGYTLREVAQASSVTESTIDSWMQKPAFMTIVNEVTKKVGFSDKDVRVRHTKRMMQVVSEKMFERVGDLDEMGFEKLHKIMLDLTALMQKETEEKQTNVVGGDLSVMIVNHFNDRGKAVQSLDDVFNKDIDKFPTLDVIDADYEEMNDNDQT